MIGNMGAIARSGLQACSDQLAVSAQNIANVSTEAYRCSDVTMQEDGSGGVRAIVAESSRENPVSFSSEDFVALSNGDLGQEMINQQHALGNYKANLKVLTSEDEITQSVLDIRA